jgi:hypothetical protein
MFSDSVEYQHMIKLSLSGPSAIFVPADNWTQDYFENNQYISELL